MGKVDTQPYLFQEPDVVELIFVFMLFVFFFVLGVWIGVLLRNRAPYDGTLVIKKDDDGKQTFLLEIETDPHELRDKDVISFKVSGEDVSDEDDI
jgi:hypothetical protein